MYPYVPVIVGKQDTCIPMFLKYIEPVMGGFCDPMNR